jgi:hypothetical protein
LKTTIEELLQSTSEATYHRYNRTAAKEVDETTKEWLRLEGNVVLLHQSAVWDKHLHRHQLEAFVLKLRNHLANKTSLRTVGLCHDAIWKESQDVKCQSPKPAQNPSCDHSKQ